MKTYMIELADDEVLVALKRGEGYEDVHPELVSEDAIGEHWPEYRTIQTGGQAPARTVSAWEHEDDPKRVIGAAQKEQAERDGGASASSVRPYSVALVRATI